MKLDIRLDVAFTRHPKTLRLKRLLGPESVICLLSLWSFVRQRRPKGLLYGLDDGDIEAASDWPGESGLFVRTLEEIGWLDRTPGGKNGYTYACHSWAEHQGYAYRDDERTLRASRAAATRWTHARSIAGSIANGMLTACSEHAHSNAPSPVPSPPPVPTPFVSSVPSDSDESSVTTETLPRPVRKPRRQKSNGIPEELRDTCLRLWSVQETMREKIPNTHRLEANEKRLAKIAERLRGGASEDDCLHVLAVYQASALRDESQRKWFNGETNWIEKNFERALGQPAPSPDSARSDPKRQMILEAIRLSREEEKR